MKNSYGYRDDHLMSGNQIRWGTKTYIALAFALLFIVTAWLALDQKLLFGDDWLSPTYDNPDWRTNEGDLHTFGMWDLESHVWKTVYIIKYWPNFHWNPYWYLGMPLIKYYQSGFYILHAFTILLTSTTPARAALLLLIFSHLAATLLTFLLCLKVSRRIWVSALCSVFLLSNTFISLRSYGWEPITVVFLWLFPLGLLLFLREPLRPFRPAMLLVMTLAYLSHPLLFFSLCMTMGIYLFAIAIRFKSRTREGASSSSLWSYFGLVFSSILVGALQFFPQGSYEQATSGAHMGVKYLPFYQVPFNIITLKDFMFDMGNLKGPGPIIMIAFFLLITFALFEWYRGRDQKEPSLRSHEMIFGLTLVLLFMVLFYYLEGWNIFPMNLLRSIQYHRIIPEFIIVAATLVAALSNVASSQRQKATYYVMLVAFVLASFIIIFNVQTFWQTTDDISGAPEFIYEPIEGRFTVPYTDQSLAVRNSFTEQHQAYGYYEQGITNSYNDEIFSVSSGYHNADLTILYLKAAHVGRIYINNEEGIRDRIVERRLSGLIPFVNQSDHRYSYFKIPLPDPRFVQAVDEAEVDAVQLLEPGCRELFKDIYCGSTGEEFVGTDPTEVAYLEGYVALLEKSYTSQAEMEMLDPDHYEIIVSDAVASTAVIVKMTFDDEFTATINDERVPIEEFGPDFMVIKPGREGTYNIVLSYPMPRAQRLGLIISILSALIFTWYFIKRPKLLKESKLRRGDMP